MKSYYVLIIKMQKKIENWKTEKLKLRGSRSESPKNKDRNMNNEIECERNNCDSDSDNLQNSWLIIPRMFQKNEIIHQAHQKAGSHLRGKQTLM